MAGKKKAVGKAPQQSPLAVECERARLRHKEADTDYQKVRARFFDGKVTQAELDNATKRRKDCLSDWQNSIRNLAKETIAAKDRNIPITPKTKKDKPLRPNPFAGADDTYVTKNKIAVTKTKNSKAKRGFTKTTQTKYYEQNESNLKLLKAAQGDTVRVGRKGTGFKKL